jgi:putative colanic acid biosynthesis UDP-glucose lipid carrier transferase
LPTVVFATTSILTLGITEFYQATNSSYSYKQVVSAVSGLVFSAILTIACLYLSKTGENYSRIWLVSSTTLSLAFLIFTRVTLHKVFNASIQPRTVVLLGSGLTPNFILKKLSLDDLSGVSIASHFSFDEGTHQCDQFYEVSDFIETRRVSLNNENPITEVWVTHSVFSNYNLQSLYEAFENSVVKIVCIPEVPAEYLNLKNDEKIQVLSGIPTINVEYSKNDKLEHLLKFLEDKTIAWLTLLLFFPILLIISIAIKLDSKGPVIFKQRRYGYGGKEFFIWKFRTMYKIESSSEFKQAKQVDPRITRVGKILRRTSLDELPQLFNVINGSMSIVGPRPHPVKLNEQHRLNIDHYMFRHAAKPGITGLAQIKGFRGETNTPELMALRVKYDLEYIENWNILLDIKILILTFKHLVTTTKAH